VLSKSKDTNIIVLGDGGWGTTLALHLAKKGLRSAIWGAFPEYLAEMASTRENRKFLPGFHIPEQVGFEPDLARAVAGADLVVLAIPSQYLRRVVHRIPRRGLKSKIWLNVSKGIENKTHALMHEVVREELGQVPYAALSGPTIAREVAADCPTAVSLASTDKKLRTLVRSLMNGEHFTVYETGDVVGVELGGAVKNVIAIGAGIVDGLGYGSNTKSVLVARGIAEIARLGSRMKAERATFMGLSGLGDLATTCFSIHSRNHACGERIGKGETLKAVTRSTEMVIEGVDTTKSAYALAKKHRIMMPIVKSVYEILFNGKKPRAAIEALMHKELVKETD